MFQVCVIISHHKYKNPLAKFLGVSPLVSWDLEKNRVNLLLVCQ